MARHHESLLHVAYVVKRLPNAGLRSESDGIDYELILKIVEEPGTYL